MFCSFVLAALSTTQTDAFARFGHPHEGFKGEGVPRTDDPSKYHNVLSHPEEADRSSDFTASSGFDASIKEKGPETISVDDSGAGVSLGPVHEDDVGAAHPESKTQKKQQPKSAAQCTGSLHDPSKGC